MSRSVSSFIVFVAFHLIFIYNYFQLKDFELVIDEIRIKSKSLKIDLENNITTLDDFIKHTLNPCSIEKQVTKENWDI